MKYGKRVLAVLILCAALGAGVVAFAAGEQGDPLVSLSYLEKIFAPTVYEKVDQAVRDNETALKADLDAAIDEWEQKLYAAPPSDPAQGGDDGACFQVVTLSSGQTLVGEVGCEVMLRIGSAVCVTDESPGLIDTTSGSILNHGGALQTNHLYMVTIPTRGVRAASNVVKVLARGSYTIQ